MTAAFHACASGPPRIAIEPVTLGTSAFHAMNLGIDRMEHGSSELGTAGEASRAGAPVAYVRKSAAAA